MLSFKRLIVPTFCLISLAAPSVAQTPGQRVIVESTGVARQEGFVRIQSSLSFFLPGPAGDGDDAQKVRERARSIVYDTAAQECDLLRKNLAKDCRLENVNTNVNSTRQFNQQQEGYNVNGTMSFQITLK